MQYASSKPGYAFLMSVLIVGAIGALIVGVLLLAVTTMSKSVIDLERSSQAVAYAHTCAERALYALHQDSTYTGNQEIAFSSGTCAILAVAGWGNTDRQLCIAGTSSGSVHQFEIDIARLIPAVEIRSWNTVPAFSYCAYE